MEFVKEDTPQIKEAHSTSAQNKCTPEYSCANMLLVLILLTYF